MSDILDLYKTANDDFEVRMTTQFGDLEDQCNLDGAYQWACDNECLMTIQWLLNHGNINVTNADIVSALWKRGSQFAKILIAASNNFDVYSCLNTVCSTDNLDAMKWLVKKYPDVDVHANGEQLFRAVCMHPHIRIVKWWIMTYPNIDMNVIKNMIFAEIPDHTLRYLLKKFPDIDVHANNCYAFVSACHRFSDMVDVLIEHTRNDNDISYHRGYVFGYIVSKHELAPTDDLRLYEFEGLYVYFTRIMRADAFALSRTMDHIANNVYLTKLRQAVASSRKSAQKN